MSHAEYAPKQLPVLTRLVMTLRQIPAVQTALARLKSLFRSGTNPEPIAIDALAAEPAVDDAAEIVDAAPVTALPAARLPFQTTSEPVVVDALPADAPVVADDTHEPDDAAPAMMQTIVARPSEAATESAIVDRLLTDASVVVADPVETAVAPAIVTPTTLLSNENALEPLTIDVVADVPLIADDIVESDHVAPAAAPPVVPLPEETTCEPIAAAFVADAPTAAIDIIKRDDVAPSVTQPTEQSEREALVRRRWHETGIRMWNPAVHGAAQSTLCIQGRVALLPPKSGETMPRYDRLEFKLIDGDVVCEGFVLEPPERPRRAR